MAIQIGDVIEMDYGKYAQCQCCERSWRLNQWMWNPGVFTGVCKPCEKFGARECDTCYRKWPAVKKFWRDYSDTCKECEGEARRKSRNNAKNFREVVVQRNDGRCEVCNLYCEHIAQIHHVIPVEEGGLGHPENLVCLCPNCHETVHWLCAKSAKSEEMRMEFVSDWMPEGANLDILGKIVLKKSPHVDEGGKS